MRKFVKIAAVLAALSSGCDVAGFCTESAPPDRRTSDRGDDLPGALVAAAGFWSARLGVPVEPSASVLWLQPDADGCIDRTEKRECVLGYYYPCSEEVFLADDGGPIWMSSLAHEALHMALDQYGDADGGHTYPAWDDGSVWEAQLAVRAWEEGDRE